MTEQDQVSQDLLLRRVVSVKSGRIDSDVAGDQADRCAVKPELGEETQRRAQDLPTGPRRRRARGQLGSHGGNSPRLPANERGWIASKLLIPFRHAMNCVFQSNDWLTS